MYFGPESTTLFIVGVIIIAFIALVMFVINLLTRHVRQTDDNGSKVVVNTIPGKAYAWLGSGGALVLLGSFLVTGHPRNQEPLSLQEEFMAPPSTAEETPRADILEDAGRIEEERKEERRREEKEKEEELQEDSDDLFDRLWKQEQDLRRRNNDDKEQDNS